MISVLIWYLAVFIIGTAFMPVSGRIFRGFRDRGWIFSKTAGLLVFAFFAWVLNVLHLIRFTRMACIFAVLIPAVIFRLIFWLRRRFRGLPEKIEKVDIKFIIAEEIIFTVIFFLWIYILGFRPEAFGTEKFMDLGFINAILRSEYMPFSDMWFSGHSVNYYYGGQFIAAFLIRITGVTSGEGYSLMRALITAASFCLPFSLVANLIFSGERTAPSFAAAVDADAEDADAEDADAEDADTIRKADKSIGYIAGALSGLAVAFCGSFHYVIYGLILPLVYRFTGNTDYSYWFPDTTRYIGYDPDLPDKTIHEFPAYSSILGDLHAHYINILFVVTVTAVAAAYLINRKNGKNNSYIRDIFSPEIVIAGLMTGLFRWINYWDLPICFVVCISVIFTANIRARGTLPGTFLTAVQGVLIYAAGYAASLPFTMLFKNDYTHIGITHSHTLPHQLVILWGFPVAVCVIFVVLMFVRYKKGIFRTASEAELIMIVFSICAMGLILLPELVYVKDIYGEDFYRANTMFKLTYQAFILFGICMGYILTKGAFCDGEKYEAKTGWISAASFAGIALLLVTAGYSITGVHDWFGNIFAPGERGTINASCFLEQECPEDELAVRFINEEIIGGDAEITGNTEPLRAEDIPVILEATSSSYSKPGRVSIYTGIPTVLGWHGHEQLWRGDSDEVSDRWYDIGNIYSGRDPDAVRDLLEKYEVDYLYVGSSERDAYDVDDSVLEAQGEVIYEDEFAYIVKTGD